MIIDFHTHIFPDSLAERAVEALAKRSGLQPQTNGTAKNTLELMEKAGIDASVCLNIATKPTQMRKINSFLNEIKSERLIPFGTIHPDAEGITEELEFIENSGIKGIKLHPDYQNFYADEKRMDEIYDFISQLGLILIFHSGYDIGLGCPIHCTPLMLKKIGEKFPKLTIVAAHFGGYGLWRDAAELLWKLDNVYFDTAFSLGLDKETAEWSINKKGAEHFILGSDCPWENPQYSIEFIQSLSISEREKELILGENARQLLKL